MFRLRHPAALGGLLEPHGKNIADRTCPGASGRSSPGQGESLTTVGAIETARIIKPAGRAAKLEMPAADLQRRLVVGALKHDVVGQNHLFLEAPEADDVLVRERVFLTGFEPDFRGEDLLVAPLVQHQLGRPFDALER